MPWAAHPRERTSEAASWRQARAEGAARARRRGITQSRGISSGRALPVLAMLYQPSQCLSAVSAHAVLGVGNGNLEQPWTCARSRSRMAEYGSR